MGAEREAKARETLDALCSQYGYAPPSVRDAVGELLARRYGEGAS